MKQPSSSRRDYESGTSGVLQSSPPNHTRPQLTYTTTKTVVVCEFDLVVPLPWAQRVTVS